MEWHRTWPTHSRTGISQPSTKGNETCSAMDLVRTKFKLLPSEGTYFQCIDISAVSDLSDIEFCKWLTTEIGVAAFPLSAFYGTGFDQRIVRFCCAKKDRTSKTALGRLGKL
jgi:methionine aminotransferase